MTQKQVKEKLLENGLKLIAEPNPLAKSSALGFFVKTGARDENAKESGVSHFLEHMMFKGTPKRSAIDITYQMGNIGAQANAYTSEENTVYYAQIIPQYFSEMQELLSDMLRPSLDPQEFDTEKKVILEEIALYRDRPQAYLFEKALADYFGKHPAGNSVLGSTNSIAALKRDEMQDYFKRRYSPSNITLVATGNFSWENFSDAAEVFCGKWLNFEAGRRTSAYPAARINQTYQKKNISQSHLLLITEGPSAQDQERYPFAVLSMILGDGTGSKLYWELVDKGLVETAGADSDERDGTGCFMAYACTETDKLEQVTEITQRVLAKPLDFTDADLERAKTKLLTKIVMSGELPMGRLLALGTNWNYNREISDLSENIAKIKAVDRQSIEQTLKKYPLKTWSEFRLVPE